MAPNLLDDKTIADMAYTYYSNGDDDDDDGDDETMVTVSAAQVNY